MDIQYCIHVNVYTTYNMWYILQKGPFPSNILIDNIII